MRSQAKITLWKVEVKEQNDAENDCGDCVQKEGKVVKVQEERKREDIEESNESKDEVKRGNG